MKYFYRPILLCCFAPFLASCGDDDFIDIDSLSADGDEFYCNQKVKVWMCVRSSDLWHTDYKWSCDGGTLTQPQGLNEMTWKAPEVPGIYTITCKATVGGKSQVRQHKMYVSSYYFDKFEKAPHSFTLQSGNKNALKKESNGNQYLQISVNSAAEVKRYVRRAFGDNTLHIPFSTRLKIGFESNVPNTQTVKCGSKEENAVLEYRWNMRSEEENNGSYVSQIRMLWYPAQVTDGYPEVPEGGMTVEGTTDYNVQLIVQHTAASGVRTTYNEYHKLNTFNTFVARDYKNVSMGVDENFMLHAFVDGAEALTSNIVATARTENQCVGNAFVNNWEIYFINGNGGRNIPVMYMDDAYGSTTEMLK